jgi:hypothetical protein
VSYGETEVVSALISVCSKKRSRGEFGERRAGRTERSDHDMNVDGPAAVPAGHDGLECQRSIAIGNLIAAHESLPGCISTDSSE